jgi:SAM-dependent methyltransferase
MTSPPRLAQSKHWKGYRDHRSHYSATALAQKTDRLNRWLEALQPKVVLDLGANTGEFSDIALATGACVVSVDQDHDCIQTFFQRHQGSKLAHCGLIQLDDILGGRGWAGTETQSLTQRWTNQFDVVMLLALIHHLAIGSSIPLSAIAEFCTRIAKRALIVEWVSDADPMLRTLCMQRNRDPLDFTVSAQRHAFERAGWAVAEDFALDGSIRTMALLVRSDA